MKLLITFLLSLSMLGACAQASIEAPTKEQIQEALDVHNKARADVGVAPLRWSDSLAKYAQAWAEYLAANGCRLKHRPNSGEWAQQHGENIYWSTALSSTLADASRGWYSEIKDFRNVTLSGDNWFKTGHYSQMVWRTTTEVGMSKAICPSGAVIIVANYNPPGNYMGQKAY